MKEDECHGKITFYGSDGSVQNQIWEENEQKQSFLVKRPQDAWFGDGIGIKGP